MIQFYKISIILFTVIFKGFLHSLGKRASSERIAFNKIFFKHTFKTPAGDKDKVLIALNYLIQSQISLFGCSTTPTQGKRKVLILDMNPLSYERRKTFLNDSLSINQEYDFYEINGKYHLNLLQKCIVSVFLIVLFVPVFIFSVLFKKYRSNIAYFLIEVPQIIAISKAIILGGYRKVFFFSSYEKESDLLSLILIKMGIEIIRIPSTNPISIHYKSMIASKVFLTAPFQLEEYETLKPNWKVDEVNFFLFEEYTSAMKLIQLKKETNTFKYNIGFLSQGYWLRKKKELNILDVRYVEAEQKILRFLYEYSQKKNLKLIVLLHPIERASSQSYIDSKKYYSGIGPDLSIVKESQSSYDYLNDVDLCVSQMSSSGIFRLFCQGKLLLVPLDGENSFKGTRVENICVESIEEFEGKIDETLRLSNSEYFNNFDLQDYSYTENKRFMELMEMSK